MIMVCAWLLATFLQEEDLFPLQEGNTWVYATNGKADVTFDITGTEKVGKRDCAILRIRGGDQESKLWLARDKDGIKVVRKSDAGGKAETLFVPTLFLKVPCKNGDKWKAGPEEYVVSGPDEIQEGGKTYSCMKVTITDRSEEGATQEYWFAPGVGPVKWTWAGGGQKVVCDLKELRKKEPEKAPLQCAKCGCAMQETDKFCGGCGAKREEREKTEKAACAKCGAKFQGDERFCAECGARREAAKSGGPLAVVPEGWKVAHFVVSPDGKVAACAAFKEKEWKVFAGDRMGKTYTFVHSPLRIGADGSAMAYAACKEGHCVMVVGDAEGAPDPRIREFAFHAGRRRVAYVVEEENVRFVVVDGKRQDPRGASDPVFSPDGNRVAYAAGTFVVVDGAKGPEFKSVRSPVFSPDGKTVAHVAGNGEGEFIVVGETPDPRRFNSVWAPAFSPDGKTVAYCAEKGGKCFVVVGDRQEAEFKRVWDPVFSADGCHVAYTATQDGNKTFVVVDGKKGAEYGSVWGIALSRDGAVVAYAARMQGGKSAVIVGEKPGDECDLVTPPIVGADGKTVAHGALQGREIRWVVRDVP